MRTRFLRLCIAALSTGALSLTLALSGCGYQPDTSAPERVEIERGADWQSALLYVADAAGPTPDFGSVRVYDNKSGLVETTVEQTMAAAPADIFVSQDGSRLFAASSVNGSIDQFTWNGNSWMRSGQTIDTPASCLSAIKDGPEGQLYAADCTSGLAAGRMFVIDSVTGKISGAAIMVPELTSLTGISWTPAGDHIYICGTDKTSGKPAMLIEEWPSMEVIVNYPLEITQVNQVEASPQGRFVYVMGRGEILKLDATSGSFASPLKPAPEPDAIYVDAAFSADGRDLFITGGPAGAVRNIYVVDVDTGALVHQMNRIADSAGGIQRVE